MADDVQLTQSGVVAGTPEYMAPEQARGEAVDHRADLFSLGCVLYALCTGASPFRGPTPLAVARRVCEQEPRPLREINPEVPAWLEGLIARLLVKDPAGRIQSACEVATLLEGYLSHLRQPMTVLAPRLPPLPGEADTALPPLGRLWLPALLAALGLGAAVWLAAGPGEPRRGQGPLAIDFRAGLDALPGVSLYGPLAPSAVKADPQGLRITLAQGRPDPSPVGVELRQRLGGDFEVSLGYELLALGGEAPRYGAGLGWRLLFEGPYPHTAVFSRVRAQAGEQYGAFHLVPGPGDKEQYVGQNYTAGGPKGRLRLVRVGTQLRYWVAEGTSDYRQIHKADVGTDDVHAIRLYATGNGSREALDLRVSDLVIDAERLNSAAGAAPPVAPAQPAEEEVVVPPGPGRGRLAAAVFVGLLIPLVLGLIAWLYTRRGRPAKASPDTGPFVSFPCPSCGTKLRARTSAAGKTVKCPRCGQSALVPGPAGG
jgi:hypothetical protein